MAFFSKRAVSEELAYLQDTQMIGAILGGTMHIIYVVMFSLSGATILLWFNLIISVPLFATAFLCSFKGYLKPAPLLGTIEVAVHQILAVMLIGQDSGFSVLLFCLIPVGILFQNWKVSFFINSLLALALFLSISWFDTGQFIIYNLPAQTLKLFRLVNSIGLFTIVGVIIYYYLTLTKKLYYNKKITSEELAELNEELNATIDLVNQQKNQIAKQHQLVSQQHKHITESIKYAERIQSALLAPEKIICNHIKDYFILFMPRDIVSGDFYWAHCKDGKFLFAVADCTGHGVPGAFLSTLGISFLNDIANSVAQIRADKVLEKLRKHIILSLHQTPAAGEAKDSIEMALCIFDIEHKTMEYASANRPVYIVRKNAKPNRQGPSDNHENYRVIQLQADRMPIGIYEEASQPFRRHLVKLNKDDKVYLFSDGYVDQIGGPRRKTFRSVYFRNLLLDIQDHSMDIQKKLLLDRFKKWKGNIEQIDDVLVVGFNI